MFDQSMSKALRMTCAVACLAVAGCSEYLDRREGIAPTAGDAVRTNIAIHAIDPWPARAASRSYSIGAERPVTRIRSFNTAAPAAVDEKGGEGQSSATR